MKGKEKFLLITGVISSVLGFVVLLGWYLHLPELIQILPSFVPMQYNTVLGFFILGLASILLSLDKRNVSKFLAAIVLAITDLTYSQYIFNTSIGLDKFL